MAIGAVNGVIRVPAQTEEAQKVSTKSSQPDPKATSGDTTPASQNNEARKTAANKQVGANLAHNESQKAETKSRAQVSDQIQRSLAQKAIEKKAASDDSQKSEQPKTENVSDHRSERNAQAKADASENEVRKFQEKQEQAKTDDSGELSHDGAEIKDGENF